MKNEEKEKKALPENLRLRRGVYFADFRIGSRRFRVSLKTNSLVLARQRLKEAIVAASSGEFDANPKSVLALKEWAEEYRRTHLVNHVKRSGFQSWSLLENEVIPYLGAKTALDQVTTGQVTRMRAELWSALEASTQNRKMVVVKHFFAEAQRRKLIQVDPAREIRKLREQTRPSRTLSELDLKRLLFASAEPLRSFLKVLVFSGLRLGEVQGLRLKNLERDPAKGVVWIKLRNEDGFRTKSGRDRNVPVSEEILLPLLRGRESDSRECLLFVPPNNGRLYHPRSAWRTIRERLELHGVTLHGLRRTYGTHLHRNGAPLASVQRLMGHANIAQTRAYIDTQDEDLLSAVQVLNPTLKEVADSENFEEKSSLGTIWAHS